MSLLIKPVRDIYHIDTSIINQKNIELSQKPLENSIKLIIGNSEFFIYTDYELVEILDKYYISWSSGSASFLDAINNSENGNILEVTYIIDEFPDSTESVSDADQISWEVLESSSSDTSSSSSSAV